MRNRILSNKAEIENRIAEAKTRGGFSHDVIIVAVTKYQTIEDTNAAIEVGLSNIGENYVQHLKEKDALLLPCKRHFIGHLQTNKVKDIIDKVEMIESVHSEKLAAEISKQACKAGITMDVLLEVNIGNEESKSGFAAEETEQAVRKIAKMPGISVKGLMAIPPIDPLPENTRKYFRNMYKLFIDIGAKNIDNSSMSVLSMGMSNDFDIAAEEGATIVRVGTALFGKRIYK